MRYAAAGKNVWRNISIRGFATEVKRPDRHVHLRSTNRHSTPKYIDAEEAVSVIKSGHSVYVHGGAATPSHLLRAICKLAKEKSLTNIKMNHIHLEGEVGFYDREYEGIFRGNSMFIGGNARTAVNEGQADFTPIFLSEIPLLYRSGKIPLDVALIHVSPPDEHGYCSLGVSICEARAAIEKASLVIAQCNSQMPRTFGDGFIHVTELDAMVQVDEPLPVQKIGQLSDREKQIGKNVAELVENGSTLQMGIGNVPNACLQALDNHKNLGVHTEMFSDGLLPLIEQGNISGMEKSILPGKIVSSFAIGTKKLYEFMDNNPSISMLDVAVVNNPAYIARNPKTVAINSCIEMDLTGQVCADSIGMKMYSGIGGQVDFMRGAALSNGGKPIMAFTSTTRKGLSRITPILQSGAGVVTTRAHVHWVVTEYGVVNLFGLSLRERANALISIAHPDHRERLEKEASSRFTR